MRRIERNEFVGIMEDLPKFHFGEVSQPNPAFAEVFGADDLKRFSNLRLGYGVARGTEALRAHIAGEHGLSKDEVMVTVGGTMALFLTAFALCEPGDEAVFTSPCWPPILDGLKLIGATLRPVKLTFDAGYRCNLEAFRAALSPRTALVTIASPQNPTGVRYSTGEIAALLKAMREICPDAYLMVDEIYRVATYGDAPIPETVATLSDRVLTSASISKSHSIAGLRTGWLTCRSPELLNNLINIQQNVISANSVLCEALTLDILRRSGPILARARRELGEAVDTVERWVDANRPLMDWVRPDGGALCCMRVSPEAFNAEAVAKFYGNARAQELIICKGNWFGDDSHVFRFGFGFQPLPVLREGLRRLTLAMELTLGGSVARTASAV